MSELTNKQVLIIGETNSRLQNLQETFHAHGMDIAKVSCAGFRKEIITEKGIDVIVLNRLNEDTVCDNVLRELKDDILNRKVPIFALVPENQEKIQEVISLGATDFVVPGEDNHTLVQKIKAVFAGDTNSSGSALIDITPAKADITATGIRVYLVEDDPLLKNLLSIRLTNSSFPFEFNSDGKDVLQKMKSFKPDVIILDLMLPGISGLEILEEVKNDESLASLPVIVFSNRDNQSDKQRAEELGAAAFYVKAMTDLSELITTIESLVKRT